MNEKTITIIAITCTIIGLIAMQFTKTEQSNETQVKITGTIESIEQKEKITILKIKTQTPLTIISFDKSSHEKGNKVQITGKLQEYRGKVEILASKITTI